MPEKPYRVLLVEDDETHSDLIARAFRQERNTFHLTRAASYGEAKAALDAEEPDLLITDLMLPGGTGIDLFVGAEKRNFPVIVMTSHGDEGAAVDAMRGGAMDYVVKTAQSFAEMPKMASRALREWELIVSRRRAEEELKKHRDHLEELVTERTAELRRANDALVRARRFETIAQLSMGLQHEIKNPLAIMRTHCEILEMDKRVKALGDENINYSLEVLKKQIDRVSATLDQLRSIAQDRSPIFGCVNVISLMDEVIDMFRPKLEKSGISAERKYDDGAPEEIEADEGKMIQLFTNLFFNAIESMKDGGKISVGIEPAQGGASVLVSVSDTGIGIKGENIQRVFDPFFTTRPDGAGMGLAVCQRIVDEHGGAIEVESKPDKGATFAVTLPVERSGGEDK